MPSAAPPAPSPAPSLFSFVLSREEADALKGVLAGGAFRPRTVPHAEAAAEWVEGRCVVTLYRSGKCTVQGRGARDFVEFSMEPLVLRRVVLDGAAPSDGEASAAGRARVFGAALSAEALEPHAGVDESGKGDFFGPLAVCAAYADAEIAPRLVSAGARDSKDVADDEEALRIAARIRAVLRPDRYALSVFSPIGYNRAYAKLRSVNRILAWAHARCIEKLLAAAPGMRFAISDQFGSPDAVRRAMRSGAPSIQIRSRTRAEADIAVAAASLLAREAFLLGLAQLGRRFPGMEFPKGAVHVRAAAETLVRVHGPAALAEACKCHFRTTDQVLAATGRTRDELPPECRVLPKPPPSFRNCRK